MAEIILKKIERVDERLLKEIVNRIVNKVHPDKIILFGSYAYGTASKDSDLDILVVVEKSNLPRYKRALPIRLALSNIIFPMDVIVYTNQEIEEWSNVPQAFITGIMRKGKIIYEKNKS